MIKSIHIKNYKSFLDERIEGFDPKINLILGSNGHGKSNLYSALRFVLSEDMIERISPAYYRSLLNVY